MIDAHLHLQDCFAVLERDLLIDQLRSLGVEHLMVNATSPEDWDAVAELADEISEVIPSFGIHPWKVKKATIGWQDRLCQLFEQFPQACVGEVGLDRWIKDHDFSRQREVLMEQLSIAERYKRSVSMHCLQAWGSLLECMQESDFSGPFLLHSYGGPQEMVQEWAEMGAYFSISGYFFRPEKAKKLNVFESVPQNRILLETDAPDMAFGEEQVRYRTEGIRNHPANLELVYESYAQWSERPLTEVVQQCEANFRQFVGELLQ